MANIMKKVLLLILIAICIAFIFFNSFQDAEHSRAGSGRIVGVIEKAVYSVYKGDPPENIVYFLKAAFSSFLRDFAHFVEFFILGILVMLYFDRFSINMFKKFIFALLFGICIALIDETIQLFSPGRAFELYDLALDGSGSIAGIIPIFLFWKIRKVGRQTKGKHTKERQLKKLR